MKEDNRLSKVEILIQQKKYSDAEKFLSDLLAEDANNIHLLSLLAEINFQQYNFDKANNIIDNAIGLSPDEPNLFYIKSRIALQKDDFNAAESLINQSIELYPYDADYFAFLANIKLLRKQFEESLVIANKALAIDAENLSALNTRSTALIKLNRSEESFNTIEGALRGDPNNAFTHANYGWGLLEKGDYTKALEHFKEALSNDPTFEYAQSGLLEALKAKNPIYRIFLKYAFWINNLTSNYQWGVIIVFYLGFRFLKSVAKNNESLQPILIPIIIILSLLAFSTWVIVPISNLFLRFNKFGQLLLSKKEKLSSSLVAISLLIFFIGIILYFVFLDNKILTIAAFGFSMMVPIGSMFSPTKNKNSLLIYTISMAVIGILAISLTFTTGEIFNSFTILYIFGFLAYQWVANYLIIKEGDN